jgi:folate-binding protein YgfZ
MSPTSAADPAAATAFQTGVVREQPQRARITIRGAERVDFVNRMCTNDVKRVTPELGVGAVLTSAKGRIVDLVRVFARDDEVVLLGSDGLGPTLKQWLEKYVVMEELQIAEATGDGVLLAFGPAAEAAVKRVLGVEVGAASGGFPVARATFDGAAVNVLGRGEPPMHTIELVAPAAAVPALVAKLRGAGLAPISDAAWEQVRVEAGIPLHGRELTENANPLEASLLSAVSFTKGCYIGQEVVARLNSYSKVQRHLVGVEFPASVDPANVNELFVDLLRIGHATSVAPSAHRQSTLALAFVKNEYSAPGTTVYTVRDGEHLQGKLSAIPFR